MMLVDDTSPNPLGFFDGDRMYSTNYEANFDVKIIPKHPDENMLPFEFMAELTEWRKLFIEKLSHSYKELIKFEVKLGRDEHTNLPIYLCKFGPAERYLMVKSDNHGTGGFLDILEEFYKVFGQQITQCRVKVGGYFFKEYTYYMTIDLNYDRKSGKRLHT